MKTVTVEGRRRRVLDEPLPRREIVRQHDKVGYVSGVVRLDLSDTFDGFERFLDRISERLVGSDILMEVNYDVVGHEGDTLLIYVSGDPSAILEMEEADA